MLTNQSSSIQDEHIVAKCYAELGYITKEKGEYDESLNYHRRSMEIFGRIDDLLSLADGHLSLAEVYKCKGELKCAMHEYEKGFAIYEDFYLEDGSRNGDSGAELSFNSSSFSDLQSMKSLSKSDETLLRIDGTHQTEKHKTFDSRQLQLNEILDKSIDAMDLIVSSKKININMGSSIDSSSPMSYDVSTDELSKLDELSINDGDKVRLSLSSALSADFAFESMPDEVDIIELNKTELASLTADNQELPLTDGEVKKKINNDHISQNHHTSQSLFSSKQIFLILFCILIISSVSWSLNKPSGKPSPAFTYNEFHGRRNTRNTYSSNDLSDQLRTILEWKNQQLASFDKNTQKAIREFLTNTGTRSKMTVDKFEKLLDILGLKIVFVPK